jgi:hypothetical protein
MQYYDRLLIVASETYEPSRPHSARSRKRPLGRSVPLGVRFFVRRHVRRRLGELEAAYNQLKAVAFSESERCWYERSAKRCADVAASIPPSGLPRIAAVVGLVGLLPKALSATHLVNFNDHTLDVILVLYVAVIILQAYFQGLRPSYRAKRRLLLGRVVTEQSLHAPQGNVYKAEEDLFDVLLRRKKPELRLDYWFDYAIGACVTAGLFGLAIANSGKLAYELAVAVALGLWIIQTLYFQHKWIRYEWR